VPGGDSPPVHCKDVGGRGFQIKGMRYYGTCTVRLRAVTMRAGRCLALCLFIRWLRFAHSHFQELPSLLLLGCLFRPIFVDHNDEGPGGSV